MPFDPDAFLRGETGTPAARPSTGGFDPDRFLAGQPQTAPATAPAADERPTEAGDIGQSLIQGLVLDPIEGVGQLASHIPYVGGAIQAATPQGLTDWANRFEKEATRTAAQRGVRIGADILNPLYWFMPEAALPRLAAAAPRVANVVRSAVSGGVGAGLQPEEGEFSWREKLNQVLAGMGLGGTLGHIAGRVRAGREAKAAAEGERTAAQARADEVAAANEAAKTQHEQATELYRAAEQHARSEEQTAAAAARTQHETAQAAHRAIPTETTQQWYREILKPIGREADAPSSVGTRELADIRDIVGGRLNQIREQMHVDAAIRPELGETFASVTRDLPRPYRTEWQRRFNKLVWQPLATPGEMTGRKLSDYLSGISDEAESLARRARSAPEADRAALQAQSDAMRRVGSTIEDWGARGDPILQRDLNAAKRSYSLWSILNGAAEPEKGGIASASEIIGEWARRQGHALYGGDRVAENVRLKGWLEQQRQRGAERPVAPSPAESTARLPRPVPPSLAPVPEVPAAPELKRGGMPELIRHVLSHAIAGSLVGGGHGLAPYFATRAAVHGALGAPAVTRAVGGAGRGFAGLGDYPYSLGAIAGQLAEPSEERQQ